MDALSLDGDLTKAKIDGAVLRKDHAEYDRYRRIWNGVADKRPAAIVRAASVGDVQKTVRIAAERGAPLAVRAGGHSLPGFSTCDDGIVLDLSQMNAVTVDAAARTAHVMGGAFLQHLDAAGAKAGLVTPAGVVSHTGVAGLTLGGGMGWLSRRYGLSIDNLIAAEMVTANGETVTASAEKEPDLFWGLRGGVDLLLVGRPRHRPRGAPADPRARDADVPLGAHPPLPRPAVDARSVGRVRQVRVLQVGVAP
jgi:FAD/FMN-containing dehydrogenase